jgi:predicted nucleic acid-binding Zn ribbon protein
MNDNQKKQEPVHIKSIVSEVLKKYSHTKQSSLFQISEIWESAVGSTIANDSRPWRIKGNELEVHVSGATWLQQLNYMRNEIIEKLNERLGTQVIQKIRFSIAHIPNNHHV